MGIDAMNAMTNHIQFQPTRTHDLCALASGMWFAPKAYSVVRGCGGEP